MMKKPDFLHVDTESWRLKVDQKILQWACSEVVVAGLQNWLYLKKELID